VTAFHAHVGTYVETEGELEELLSRVDASLVGVCIDSGHLAYAGADPVAITKRHRARVKHVHLKDVDERTLAQARRDKLSFREAVGKRIFVPLGTGMVDLPSMLHELEEASFDGWLVVEQDTRILTPEQEGQPLRDATTSRQELRRLLGR
jgi:inosose dehydratase